MPSLFWCWLDGQMGRVGFILGIAIGMPHTVDGLTRVYISSNTQMVLKLISVPGMYLARVSRIGRELVTG